MTTVIRTAYAIPFYLIGWLAGLLVRLARWTCTAMRTGYKDAMNEPSKTN